MACGAHFLVHVNMQLITIRIDVALRFAQHEAAGDGTLRSEW